MIATTLKSLSLTFSPSTPDSALYLLDTSTWISNSVTNWMSGMMIAPHMRFLLSPHYSRAPPSTPPERYPGFFTAVSYAAHQQCLSTLISRNLSNSSFCPPALFNSCSNFEEGWVGGEQNFWTCFPLLSILLPSNQQSRIIVSKQKSDQIKVTSCSKFWLPSTVEKSRFF